MTENTQLTLASGYDTKRMIFSVPQVGSIPNSLPPISYKRINISTTNEDGSIGDLIIPTDELFSFGPQENLNLETQKVNGYVMPLCLYNRDGPTKSQKEWVDTFNAIVDKCKDHLVTHREEIGQYDLTKNDLKKFNPLYYKKEKGKIVEGTGPTMYAKLIVSKKQNKVVTMFFDYDGESIDALTLLGKYCFAKAAIKIESIFIGKNLSLQIKLYECELRLMETGMKRLLRRPTAQKRVLTSNNINPLNETVNEDEKENSDVGSISGSEDETPATKPIAKKVVKRKVKKVVRKTVAVE